MAKGINIPIRIQNELAAGLDVASADLKKFTDGAIAANTRQIQSLRAAARQYSETASSAVKGSDEQRAAIANLEASLKKLARMEGYVSEETSALAGKHNVALSGSFRTLEKDTSKATRGFLAGSGALAGLGRSVAFASTAFIGAAGLTEAFKLSFHGAELLDKAHAGLSTTIKQQNGNVRVAIPLIDKWAAAQSKLGVSITDSESGLRSAFATTHNMQTAMWAYQEALELHAINPQISFQSALQASTRAQIGSTQALSRYIGTIPKGTSALQLHTLFQQRYAGQAQANTTATDKLHASLSNMFTKIGEIFLPELERLSGRLADWFSNTKNQKRVTDDLKTAIDDIVSVIKTMAGWIEKINNLTGGWKNTLKAIAAIALASKINGWMGALKNFSTSLAGDTGAMSRTGRLLANMKGLAAVGALSIGVDLLFTSKGQGSKGLIGAILTGAAAGFMVGGPWGAAIGALMGGGLDLYLNIFEKISNTKYKYKGGSEVRNLGHGVDYDAATNQYYWFHNGVQEAIGRAKAAKILHKTPDQLLKMQNAPGGGGVRDIGGHANPFKGDTYARTDQGVDVSGKAVRAITSGTIISVGSGMSGGTGLVVKQSFDSPMRVRGRTYYGAYYSEGKPAVQKNDHVHAGEIVMTGSSFEVGFLLGPNLEFPPLRGGLGAGTKPDVSGQDLYAMTYGKGSSGGGSPYGTSVNPPPPTKHQHHLTAAQKAAAEARKRLAHTHKVISNILGISEHDANRLTVAQGSSGTIKGDTLILKDEKKLLKDYEDEANKIRQKMKSAHGKDKEAYKKALDELEKKIASGHKDIIKTEKDLAKLAAEKAAKLKQKLIDDTTNALNDIEKAADAVFAAQMKPYQDELAKMQAQDVVNNDAKAIADAQRQLSQDIILGNVSQIMQDQATLIAAQNQQTEDQLQAKINAIQGNEDAFNTAIENMIAKVNGTNTPSVSSALDELIGAVGAGSGTFSQVIALLNQYLPPVGGSGGGGGGSGGGGTGGGGTGGGGGGGGCFTAETPIATLHGDVEIGKLAEGHVILTWDFESQSLQPAKISEVVIHNPMETWIIMLKCGNRVVTTKEHPFWYDDAWRPAGDLRAGKEIALATYNGNLVLDEVVSVAVGPQRMVYNLEVDHPDHNYLANGCLVHNRLIKLASGGMVTRPTLALIGERGPEEVIPLSRANQFGSNVTLNVTVNGVIASDLKKAAHDLAPELRRELLRVQARNGSLGFH